MKIVEMYLCSNEDCETTYRKDKNTLYCPECGSKIKKYDYSEGKELLKIKKHKNKLLEEPKISTATKIWLILALILVFPIGLIASLFVYKDHQKKKEIWQRERIINKI